MSEPEGYVRYRQASRERVEKAKLALDRYEIEVREGRRQADGGERLRHELKVETERMRWEALMEEQLRELRRTIARQAALDA